MVDSLIIDSVTENLLKSAAGMAIGCQVCGSVLNWDRTIIVDAAVLCYGCFSDCCANAKRDGADLDKTIPEMDLTMAHNIHTTETGIEFGAQVIGRR